MSKCLQQLQESNPSLLLTGASLRKAERDAFYVPAIAEAIASVLLNPTNPDIERLSRLAAWETQDDEKSTGSDVASTDMSFDEVCQALEQRIRLVISQPERCDETEPIAVSQCEGSSVSESCSIDWGLLQEDIPVHPNDGSQCVTNHKPSVLNRPTPTYQDPRKLLYASSEEESDGYIDL